MILKDFQVTSIIDHVRSNGGCIIFTNGCFDIFHIGHLRTIKYAANMRSLKDILLVGINSDKSAKELKGEGRPIFPLKYRGEVIDSLSCVDGVVMFDDVSVFPLIELIKPDILVKGGSTGRIVGQEFVEGYGGRVERAPLMDGTSTTDLVKKCWETYENDPKVKLKKLIAAAGDRRDSEALDKYEAELEKLENEQ